MDVWWARPSQAGSWNLDLLDDHERARHTSYRRAEDKDRFATGATVLRLAGARALGVPPAQLVVDRTCPSCGKPHGKPRIAGRIELSVSHSGDRVAVAMHIGAPVGIDVERIAPVDLNILGPSVLAPGEAATTLPDFFRYWSRKESVLKATGDGLRVAMTGVTVSPPSAAPALLRYAGRDRITATMADLLPGGEYAAAVTVLDAGPLEVHERDAAELIDVRR